MPLEAADRSYLLDMLRHAQGAMDAVAGMTFEQYELDENLRLSIERRVEIIGEAARRLSVEFQKAHPDVPWARIVAQRNVLAHNYGEIDDELLWRVATVHIPQLVNSLKMILG
jgi:uncharacterized protein with HEPN domain